MTDALEAMATRRCSTQYSTVAGANVLSEMAIAVPVLSDAASKSFNVVGVLPNVTAANVVRSHHVSRSQQRKNAQSRQHTAHIFERGYTD